MNTTTARPYAGCTTGDLEQMLLAGEGSHVVRETALWPAPLEREIDRLIAIARELWLRQIERDGAARALNSPRQVQEYLRDYLASSQAEQFLVVYLCAQNHLIATEEAFRGTLTQCSVYPREIVKRALSLNAASVILAHNHPSGTAEPSRADELLTQALKSALSVVDVRVLDHIVVGGSSTVSFAERGLL